MANIELLAEITASGMYILHYFTKVFFGSNYSKEGIPFFRSQNVQNDGIVLSAHPTNPVEGRADANPKTMLPNDT